MRPRLSEARLRRQRPDKGGRCSSPTTNILRPDTPLDPDVKQMTAGQLDNGEDRFAVILD